MFAPCKKANVSEQIYGRWRKKHYAACHGAFGAGRELETVTGVFERETGDSNAGPETLEGQRLPSLPTLEEGIERSRRQVE
jgi:hypothetical protein